MQLSIASKVRLVCWSACCVDCAILQCGAASAQCTINKGSIRRMMPKQGHVGHSRIGHGDCVKIFPFSFLCTTFSVCVIKQYCIDRYPFQIGMVLQLLCDALIQAIHSRVQGPRAEILTCENKKLLAKLCFSNLFHKVYLSFMKLNSFLDAIASLHLTVGCKSVASQICF